MNDYNMLPPASLKLAEISFFLDLNGCFLYHKKNQGEPKLITHNKQIQFYKASDYKNNSNFILAPFLETIKEKLRNAYNINVMIEFINNKWKASYHNMEDSIIIYSGESFETYEKALDDILYTIVKKIKNNV